jgi:transcriptional regulator with GAF, ATPase, and Fis domain
MAANRDKLRGEWILSWLYPVLAAVMAFIAPLLWDAALDDPDGVGASPYLYVGIVLGVGAVVLTVVQGAAATASIRASRRQISDFNHKLVDTIKVLGDLPEAENGPKARRDFLHAVTREAKSIMDLPGQRICVYELDSADDEQSSGDDQGARFLRLIAYAGRADQPRERFTTEDQHGADAIANAMSNTAQCYDRAEKPSFVVNRDPNAPWRSFIAVPLHVDHRPRGLMTIDTTLAMKFTSDHIATAMTIGRFIEIGLKSSYSAAVETAPEVRDVKARLALAVDERPSNGQMLPVQSEAQDGR